MITQCPVDAIGDSIIICKVGTNNVAGSGMGPMTWTEYMSSIYTGGEGTLVDCKTGKPLFKQLHTPVISLKNKQLVIDERLGIEVYDAPADKWVNIELPFWRKRVYAMNGELKITADSMVFKPPFHGPKAFASVSKEYEAELKKTDHYMITNTVYRLLTCSMCGDAISKQRLLNIEQDFAGYYKDHDDSKELLDKALVLYHAYDDYLQRGGKRTYFDLNIFPYFQKQSKSKTTITSFKQLQ